MAEELARQFRVVLPDNALAPDLLQGDELLIDRNVTAEPGDLVLVRDKSGHHYARFYRQRQAGEWQAVAVNPSYEPMNGPELGLKVVGVCIGETRLRRRSGVVSPHP